MDFINDNSDAIVGIAAAVQAIFTVVLVAITCGYAKSTRVIASETRGMATATERMTQLTNNQRLDTSLPIVGFQLDAGAQMNQFALHIINMGVGPALDLTVTVNDSPMRWYGTGPILPTAIPAGEDILIRYRIRDSRPFTDTALVSWPRDDEDRDVSEAAKASMRGGSAQQQQVRAAQLVRDARFNEYLNEVRVAASQFASGGTLRATYRDVHGRELVSRATLDATLDPDSHPEAWKTLSLGALKFVQPSEVTG